MITGLGLGAVSVTILTSAVGASVADAEGEFLATDGGVFFATSDGEFLLTNVELKKIQTGTSLDFLTSDGDTINEYIADGETTSAPDPE